MSEPNDATAQPTTSDRELLTGLMSLAGAKAKPGQPAAKARAAWSTAELAAIWRHQLKAPLVLDLGGINDDANATVTLHSAQDLVCFGDLMGHPRPPIELLQLAKEFAKSQRYAEDAAFPVETASVLYYAAITLALLRMGQRITEMDDARLRQGVQWSLQQPWLDAATRALFEEAAVRLA